MATATVVNKSVSTRDEFHKRLVTDDNMLVSLMRSREPSQASLYLGTLGGGGKAARMSDANLLALADMIRSYLRSKP